MRFSIYVYLFYQKNDYYLTYIQKNIEYKNKKEKMIYIGYPVELKEACRLLKIHLDEDLPYKEYCEYFPRIHKYFQKHGIEFIRQDKGLCIIGIQFDKLIGDIWHMNSSCDEAMILTIQSKQKVEKAIKDTGIDLSTIYIAHMEGEEVEMHNPQPFFIHCPFDY